MLFKNGSFHLGEVQFRIPDGYFLETNPGLTMNDGIALYFPEQNCLIEISGERSRGADSKKVLEDFVEGFIQIAPIEPYSHNGLTGYVAIYKDRRIKQYCELLFDIENDKYELFRVYFEFPNGEDIVDFANHPIFIQVMQGIQKII